MTETRRVLNQNKVAGGCLWPKITLGLLCMALLLWPAMNFAGTYPYVSGHQLNFATGNKYLSVTDYSSGGLGLTLDVTREYNSQSELTSPFGYGWSVNMYDKIEIADSYIVHIKSGGRHTLYNLEEDQWVNEVGKKKVIVLVDGLYTLTYADGSVQVFNGDGTLASMADKNGNSRSYAYSDGLLASVTDDVFGRTISFTYENGYISELVTPLGSYGYGYDSDGNLTSVTKPDGTMVQYLYDDANDIHNLTGIIDETEKRTLTVAYDENDRVISSAKTGGLDAITINYVDATNREVIAATADGEVTTSYVLKIHKGIAVIESSTGPGCASCGSQGAASYTYNDRLQPLSMTDGRGIVTNYVYDDSGNRTKKVEAAGTELERATSWTYYTDTNLLHQTIEASVNSDDGEVVTEYAYDANGNIATSAKTVTTSEGTQTRTTAYTYDALGRIKTIDGPREDVSDIITFAYYDNDEAQGLNRARLHTVTNGLNHVVTYSDYNEFGQAETIADPNGLSTQVAYNAAGQLASRTVGSLTTSYDYDAAGRIKTVTAPGNRTFTYSYDDMGLVNKVTDNLGNAIVYQYDVRGKKIRQDLQDSTGTLQSYAEFEYDDNGRLKFTINPDGSKSELGYDEVGNLVSAINELGQETEYTIDALNRVTEILAPGEEETKLGYNSGDLQKTVTDAEGHVTSYSYDDFGNRVSRTSPETGTTGYTYDIAGNLKTVTQASGTVISYSYDVLNRPKTVSVDGDEVQAMNYDTAANGIGKLATLTDSSGSTSYSYNALGQLTSEARNVGAFTLTTQYGYDGTTAEPKTLTYPSGLTVTYLYDTLGRISGLQLDGATVMENGEYLPYGPVSSYDFGEGLHAVNSYDQRYQLKEIDAAGLNYKYTRDLLGRVLGIEGLLPPVTEGDTADYDYESGTSRLAKESEEEKDRVYVLDTNGNTRSDGVFDYSYDGFNRLVKVEKAGAVVATYQYDAQGRRTSKMVGAETTYYAYDIAGHLIAEVDGSGTSLRDYIYFQGAPFAVRTYSTDGGLYYYLNDHLGTPQRLVDGAGTAVWQVAYSPFGKAQVQVEDVANNMRFPGQYYDSETGLHYNWHRFYDPETGRYISADPIGLAGGMNLYAYTNQNPINAIDPEGLNPGATTWAGAEIGTLLGGPVGGVIGGVIGFGVGIYVGQQAWNVYESRSVHPREEYLRNFSDYGLYHNPNDPDDRNCDGLLEVINEIDELISSLRGQISANGGYNTKLNPNLKGHPRRIRLLEQKKAKLNSYYNEHCKPCE